MKIKKPLTLILMLSLLISNTALAYSTGSLDTAFNPGVGTNDAVRATVLQPDGKVIISGDFTTFNNIARNRLARLNADGTLDTSFVPGAGADSYVYATALQSDGKIIIGGSFATYGSVARSRVARLNSNGTLDTSFDPGAGANAEVSAITIQPDGKVIIGGSFTSYSGIGRNGIARLNADGSLDTTFNPGTGIGGTVDSNLGSVLTIVVQSDRKIIIAGSFDTYNGTARNAIVRVNTDGTLDTTFNPGTGANNGIISAVLQPDNKMLIVGRFTTFAGVSRNSIARLNTDGSLDTTFNPGTGANFEIYSASIQPDTKIIIGGVFNTYNGIVRNNIARLNSNGSLDTSFNSATEVNKVIFSTSLQPDGRIIIGGNFNNYNSVLRNNIARLSEGSGSLAGPLLAPDMTALTDTGTSNTDNITSDSTPDFVAVTCVSGNTVTLYVDGFAILPTAVCSNNTATITPTVPLIVGPHSVTYTEKNGGIESGQSPILPIVISSSVASPAIQEVVPIGTTTDNTPNYTFSTDKAGTITYGGYCSSSTTSAVVGFNTVTFNFLPVSGYINCTVRVTDSSGNVSNLLSVTPFSIIAINQQPTNQPTPSTSTVGCTANTPYSPLTGAKCPYIAPQPTPTFVDTNPVICPHFTKYVKKGSPSNDQNEVMRWQDFLNQYENEFLTVDGKLGRLTFDAVRNFQAKYSADVLAPWGLTAPTGYIYKSTRAKANKIFGCSEGTVLLDNGQTVNY